MGAVFSCITNCCGSENSTENDPLLQNQQEGYRTNDGGDYDVMQRQLQIEEQKLMQRERELTDIVNNTNDKLIDISMMSNSGIVMKGHDIEAYLTSDDGDNAESGEEGALKLQRSSIQVQKFTPLNAQDITSHQRQIAKKLYADLFKRLDEQLRVDMPDQLIVTL